MNVYNPFDWYWIVAGDETKRWSSKTGGYVTQWPANSDVTRIASEDELRDVLAPYGLSGPGAFKPLLPWQFRAMLDIAGIAETISAAIAAIPDVAQKAVAKSKLEYALAFHRDDPLIAMLAPAVGLSDEQINAMWHQAEKL